MHEQSSHFITYLENKDLEQKIKFFILRFSLEQSINTIKTLPNIQKAQSKFHLSIEKMKYYIPKRTQTKEEQ